MTSKTTYTCDRCGERASAETALYSWRIVKVSHSSVDSRILTGNYHDACWFDQFFHLCSACAPDRKACTEDLAGRITELKKGEEK
jgi:hypothetical protein